MNNLSRGVVYIATGSKYVSEVVHNALLSKRFNPDLSFTLISDVDPIHLSHIFDYVINISEPVFSYEDKIIGLNMELPYDQVLFLTLTLFDKANFINI